MADIFRANAPDVELVWSPAWRSLPDESWNKMAQYYPGDAYVDVIGCSIYNKYGAETNTWRSFATLVTELEAVSSVPPLMMSEGASLEDPTAPTRKAQWIADMSAYVKAHPRWESLLWFHRPPTTKEPIDFRIDTTQPPLDAWRKVCADAYYQA
jgi:Glycosyl hydrolase family 26